MGNFNMMTLKIGTIRQDRDLMVRHGLKADPRHVNTLKASLGRGVELPPILVWANDQGVSGKPKMTLLDGLHRLTARRLRGEQNITARVLFGSYEEALFWLIAENGHASLPLTRAERMRHAWRLVRETSYSKADVVRAGDVSEGAVAEMRRVKRAFEETGAEPSGNWSVDKRGPAPAGEITAPTFEEMTDHQKRAAADIILAELRGSSLISRMLYVDEEVVFDAIAKFLRQPKLDHFKDYLGNPEE